MYPLFGLCLVAACSAEELQGSGTLQSNSAALFIANPDHGSLSVLNRTSGQLETLDLGSRPSRVAKYGERLYVSNRGERSVSVLRVDEFGGVELIGAIQTGAEPIGVAANEERVWVAASLSGEVIEYDAQTFEQTRSWRIEKQPRGLAYRDGALYVTPTFGNDLAWIDIDSGEVALFAIPELVGFDVDFGRRSPFVRRSTGDPAISPDGKTLAVPVLFVNQEVPIPDLPAEGPPDVPATDGYDGRFIPGVFFVEISGSGPKLETKRFTTLISVGHREGRTFAINSYPSGVTFTPDSKLALVTNEGAGAVFVIDQSGELQDPPTRRFSLGLRTARSVAVGEKPAFTRMATEVVMTNVGLSGIAAADNDSAFVHSLFDRTVQKIDLASIRQLLKSPDRGLFGVGPSEVDSVFAADAKEIAPAVLTPEVDAGRRMFFSSSDPRVSGEDAGVSCATCHFDGRTDGLTWIFERGPRQTPSLAGDVSRSEPVGWSGDRPTVADDAMLTSQSLMGGQNLAHSDSLNIEAFVNQTPDIDNPFWGVDDDKARRGAAIFHREDVGCGSCHVGAAFSNNEIVSMYGLEEVKVRPLNGIWATAPYLHDGSAATLRDVLERSRDGSMGDTSMLSDEEMDELEFFLKTL